MTQTRFFSMIKDFNDMYKLDNHDEPTLLGPERIRHFVDILQEEVEEAQDILANYQEKVAAGVPEQELKYEVLTDMADWLGDIVVYCASEARRWGLPLEDVLKTIMESNFSKLGSDGEPIYDQRGKVMKGPDYWKPEPKIRQLLEGSR